MTSTLLFLSEGSFTKDNDENKDRYEEEKIITDSSAAISSSTFDCPFSLPTTRVFSRIQAPRLPMAPLDRDSIESERVVFEKDPQVSASIKKRKIEQSFVQELVSRRISDEETITELTREISRSNDRYQNLQTELLEKNMDIIERVDRIIKKVDDRYSKDKELIDMLKELNGRILLMDKMLL